MSHPNKDVQAVLQPFVDRYGLTVKKTKTHVKITYPATGRKVSVSLTPSDHRALLNIRRDLRHLVQGDAK